MERLKKGFNIFLNDIKGLWIGALVFVIYSILSNFFLDRYCPMVLLTGLPCPACGMTRASILLVQGHFVDALIMHPMVLSVFLLFIAFCLFRYVFFIDTKDLSNVLLFLLIMSIFVYIFRMLYSFPSQSPMVYYTNNLIHRWLLLFK